MAKGLIFDAWGAQETQTLPEGRHRLFPPFRRKDGHCFAVGLSPFQGGLSDTASDSRRSRLQLFEDDRLLGPRHAIYEQIVEGGGGQYDHFDGVLYFSTSDNSDPSRNGRTYSYSLGEPTPKVLGIGGCHMNGVVRDLHNRHLIDVRGLGMGVAYSPLEGRRLVERLLGLREDGEGLGRYANSTETPDYDFQQELGDIDILMLEVTAHTNLLAGDLCLNRCAIITDFLNVAGTLGEEIGTLSMQWYSNGLLKQNETARADSAAALVTALQGSVLDTEVNHRLLAEARGVRESIEEMVENTRVLQELVGAPRLVILYGPNVFFPDGRGISWHANLESDSRELASRLEAPFVNIGALVKERGFAFSVLPDMVHHTDAFMGVIGDAALKAAAEYGPLRPLAKPSSPRR